MPVCLLLRVHSTAPGGLDRVDAREQLAQARRGSRAGRGSRRGSGARRARIRGAGWADGARRSGTARRTRARRGSPTPPRTRPCRRRGSCARRARSRRVAVRRLYAAGCVQRTISSTPVAIASASSRSTASWSGNSVERDDRARDRVARRVGARGPQQAEEELQLLVGQLGRVLARQRRVAHDREHVVGGVRALLGDQPGAVLEHRRAGLSRRRRSSRTPRARPRKSKLCSIHSNSWCRSCSGMPSSMQIACIGSSPATAVMKSHVPHADERVVDELRGAPPEVGFHAGDRARREALAHEHADALVPRVVHHVEHHPGDRQVGDGGAAVGPVAAGLRRERAGIVDDRHALGVGVHRPEAFAVGRVRGRLVPPHRRVAAQAR